MKENRALLLVGISISLMIISFLILGVWGYHQYFNNQGPVPKVVKAPILNESTENSLSNETAFIVDSTSRLDTMLNNTILNADSLIGKLNMQADDFTTLRNEIIDILKTPVENADLNSARAKLEALNIKVEDLINKNANLQAENKKLASALDKLSAINKKNTSSNKVLENFYKVQNLTLSALFSDGINEIETTDFLKAEKFKGQLNITNVSNPAAVTEIIIVIIRPNGRILNNGWDSGIYKTSSGDQLYTCKLRFDCAVGESKKVNFVINTDSFEKGKYVLRAFYNGKLIANALKSLK